MAKITIPDEPTIATFPVTTANDTFPIDFAVFAKADLRVMVGVTELEQGDFLFDGTLLDGGGYQGGTVTLNTPAASTTVRIWRDLLPQRSENFGPVTSVPVSAVDLALSRQMAVSQDIKRDQEAVLDALPYLADLPAALEGVYEARDEAVAATADKANRTLGNLTDANAAVLNLKIVYIESFVEEADGDDIGPALQRAHDYLAPLGGGKIAGRAIGAYMRTAITFTVPIDVDLAGFDEQEVATGGTCFLIPARTPLSRTESLTATQGVTYQLGGVVYAYDIFNVVVTVGGVTKTLGTDYTIKADIGKIKITSGGGIANGATVVVTFNHHIVHPITCSGTAATGTKFRNFRIEEEHPPIIDAAWTPDNNPAVFNMIGMAGGCYFDNLLIIADKWIRSVGSGRTSWGRIWGVPFRRGFFIDECYDAVHGNSLHGWPFVAANSPYYSRVQTWTIQNADMFVLGRCDTPMIPTVFNLGCRALVRPIKTDAGVPSKINIATVINDNCKYVIYDIDGDCDGMDAIIGQVTHQALTLSGGVVPVPGGRGFQINSSYVNIQIGTYFAEFYARYGVVLNGTGCGFQIANLKVDRPNEDNAGFGFFKLAAGNNVQVAHAEINALNPTPLNDSTSASVVYLSGKPVYAGELIPVGKFTTCSVYSQTGTITDASAVLRYQFDGSWADCTLVVEIHDAGTGGGFLFVDFPFDNFISGPFLGRDVTTTTAYFCTGEFDLNDNVFRIIKLDSTTSMIVTGVAIRFTFRVQRKALV